MLVRLTFLGSEAEEGQDVDGTEQWGKLLSLWKRQLGLLKMYVFSHCCRSYAVIRVCCDDDDDDDDDHSLLMIAVCSNFDVLVWLYDITVILQKLKHRIWWSLSFFYQINLQLALVPLHFNQFRRKLVTRTTLVDSTNDLSKRSCRTLLCNTNLGSRVRVDGESGTWSHTLKMFLRMQIIGNIKTLLFCHRVSFNNCFVTGNFVY